jgi:hypothetical protein
METLYEEGRKGERRNEKMTQKQLHMPFCNINVPLAKRSESLRRFFSGIRNVMRGFIPCRPHAERSKKAIYIYTAGYYRRSIRQQGEPKACSCPLMQVSLHLHISDITGSIRSRPRLSEEWGREGGGEARTPGRHRNGMVHYCVARAN